jgi:hypothetical protein
MATDGHTWTRMKSGLRFCVHLCGSVANQFSFAPRSTPRMAALFARGAGVMPRQAIPLYGCGSTPTAQPRAAADNICRRVISLEG